MDPSFEIVPKYWVETQEVNKKLSDKDWNSRWLMGWRGVTSTTNARTLIASVFPAVAVQHNLLLFSTRFDAKLQAALLANMNCLVLDYICKVKVGSYMSQFVLKQLPILIPKNYEGECIQFIVSRVLELTYTAHDLQAWAQDLGYTGAPFAFDPIRRAQLRAELDAWYAKAYGLTRDELRYILDPADVMGIDYPSETFRGLKKNEEREFGEYRTQRLVLEAWDNLEKGKLE